MNAILRLVGARPEDQRKLLLMAPVFFVCGIAEMLNYNSFMTLFNQRFGSEYLPYVYAAEAIILPLEAWLLAWLAAKLPKPKLMRVMYGMLIGIVAGCAAALIAFAIAGADIRWFYPVLFIASSFVVRQQTILLWSLAIDACPTQQAKRLMPVFVGSATLGGVAAGLLAQLISLAFGPEAIYAAGCALLLAAWPNYRKVISAYLVPLSLKLTTSVSKPQDEEASAGKVFKQALSSPFLLTVILLMTFMPGLYFLMEYEFLNVAKTSYATEQQFSRFFGLVTTVLFVLAFLLQLVSGKLMARLGASHMLTMIAGVYVLSFAGAVLFIDGAAALPIVSAGYMLLYLLLYYTAEPSYQLFFKTLPLAQRDSYRYAAQGIAASAGILIGAGLQFMHAGFGVSWTILSLIGLIGAGFLLALAWYGRRLYIRELVRSVSTMSAADMAESMEEIGRNGAALAEARRMLKHPSSSAKEIALQIIGPLQNPKDLPDLLPLLDDDHYRIRIEALKAMNLEHADLQALVKVASFLEDPDDELRAEGVKAIARMKHLEEQAFFFLRQKLLDRHPGVVAEAVKAMYSFHREQSYKACAEVIERILSVGGETAVYMCRVVADLKLDAYIPQLMDMLGDLHPAARVAATESLGRLGHADLVPVLIDGLAFMDEEMLAVSTQAFIDIGPAAVQPLTESLPQASPKHFGAAVHSLSMLMEEEEVREVLAADGVARLSALEQAAAYSEALRALGREELAQLASMRWEEARRSLFGGLWSIQSRLGDENAVIHIRTAIESGDEEARSNAQEVLAEGFGDRRLSQAIAAFIERSDAVVGGLAEADAKAKLMEALRESDDWWREMAMAALSENGGNGSMSNEGLMMSRLNKVVFLKQVPYFADLSLEELGLIANVASEENVSDEEALLRRGEPHSSMYVIVDGNIELTSVSAAGWEGTIGVLGPGDVCGVTSALDGTPSTVTAQSLLGDTKVLRLSGDDVSRLVRLYPEIGIGLLRASFARIRLLEEMMMRIDS
ncbi:cyclic nucleotide-binding domain-containing protein [Paenibacillus soyae]|uniref:Cyclic nucleotide-binding domain-containing protein n=1 Tax=Paenibacillus soyae TaxID=2969249 RepID=A0A9X2MLD1_9BACL|nr:cyclic nucleotide-binding domain-containing protein [Paenibacillus soyae]MCR2802455.1 cyclic nucleotide-binding domain-containing protein [Paenibacillus soyae]